MSSKDRKLYLDVLKIFACFAVILQHNVDLSVTADNVWAIEYIFYYLGRFAVPIFVMSSGVLLLDEKRDLNMGIILKKYIPRLLVPLIGIVYIMHITDMFLTKQFTWKIIYRPFACVLTNNVSVPYWYIYMLIGLYLILPFIRKMVHHSTKKELEYFLLLFFGVRACVPLMDKILRTSILGSVSSALMLNILSGYVGFLILGHYLDKYVREYKIWYLVVADVLCLIGPVIYTFAFAGDKRAVGLFFADIFSANMIVHSCLLFLIAKKGVKKLAGKGLVIVSNSTFLIYILHVYILQIFQLVGVSNISNSLIRIPVCALMNFLVCTVISLLIKGIKKKVRSKRYANV